MSNLMIQCAKSFNGKSEGEFIQSSYISSFNKELQGGCCMTLCCCWALSKGKIDTFQRLIYSKIGMNQVKGFQGLAVSSSGPAMELGGYYTGFVREIWKIFGIVDSKRYQNGHFCVPELFCRFVCAKYAYYQLHFTSFDMHEGHAIAFLNTPDGIHMFDPNFGQVWFGGKNRKSNLKRMLVMFLPMFYPLLNGPWECISGKILGSK